MLIERVRIFLNRSPKIYSIAAAIYHQCKFAKEWTFYTFFRRIRVFPRQKSIDPSYKSQFGQDKILSLLSEVPDGKGFFVEVGANHPVHNSNSHYFEHQLGYHGISIDPIDYSDEYSRARPRTNFVRSLVAEHEERIPFSFVQNVDGWENQLSSVASVYAQNGKSLNSKTELIQATTLHRIVSSNSEHCDILMLDVEGFEIEVLKSARLDIWRPSVVLVENTGAISDQKKLQKFMEGWSYKLIARIWTSDDIYIAAEGV